MRGGGIRLLAYLVLAVVAVILAIKLIGAVLQLVGVLLVVGLVGLAAWFLLFRERA